MKKAKFDAKKGYDLTEGRYGFRYGPATVVRLFSDKRGVGLMVQGNRQSVQLWVTPTGLVRVGEIHKTTYSHPLAPT